MAHLTKRPAAGAPAVVPAPLDPSTPAPVSVESASAVPAQPDAPAPRQVSSVAAQTVVPPTEQRPATPMAALAELLAGNERFVRGNRIHPHQDAEHRTALAAAQRPFAVVFGCSDSRLAAEIIFDRGLGDLFVVRTAGHIVGAEVMASIEYGVTVLGASLVVVLGHDSCGAIQATHAALPDAEATGPHLRPIVDAVLPSVREALDRQLTDLNDISVVHVQRTVEMISAQDTPLGQAVTAGQAGVVGMSYRLNEGRVNVVSVAPATVTPTR